SVDRRDGVALAADDDRFVEPLDEQRRDRRRLARRSDRSGAGGRLQLIGEDGGHWWTPGDSGEGTAVGNRRAAGLGRRFVGGPRGSGMPFAPVLRAAGLAAVGAGKASKKPGARSGPTLLGASAGRH